MKLSGTKAILYDLDGVLVDACEWHYESLNKALMAVCGFKLSPREHEVTFNGLPTQTKLGILEEQGRIERESFEAITTLKQQCTMELLEDLTIDEGKVDLHRRVYALGIKMACVTNAIRPSAETMLRNTGQLAYMEIVVSNQDIAHPKPCGEGYIVAMVRLGVLPSESLIVEDSPRGLQAAESTGAHVLRVANATEVSWERVGGWLQGQN
jgi:beta-phosphoglucomutase-like phosphatase (HAD superfamily)